MASNQFQWQSNNGDVPLMLEVQKDFIPVSGILPTVEVYRLPDHFFADWTDLSFKAPAVVGDRFGVMSEVPSDRGVYLRFFNPIDFSQNLPIQNFYVRYRATIPSGTLVGAEILNRSITLEKTETHSFLDHLGSGITNQIGLDLSFGC